MALEEINYWLGEGEQSKITPDIKEICSQFKGDNLDKISQILGWINNNLSHEKNYNTIIKTFASRNVEELIKSKNHTGCHDVALILATFLRATGIPSKYIVGIGKQNPENSGHCVVKSYIEGKWVLIDQGNSQISFIPSKSSFYNNYHVVKEGLDSWDCGIKTFDDWRGVGRSVGV